MTRSSRKDARRALGFDVFKRLERKLHAYAVVADNGAVITAGYRRNRLKRA